MEQELINKIKQIFCKHDYRKYWKYIDESTTAEIYKCPKCQKEVGNCRALKLASWRTLWRN